MVDNVDLLVFLDTTPEVAAKRIRERDLLTEKDVYDFSYLSGLRDAYNTSISKFIQLSDPRTLEVDSDSDGGENVNDGDICIKFATHPTLLYLDSIHSPHLGTSTVEIIKEEDHYDAQNHWKTTVLDPILDRLGVNIL